MDIRTLQRPLKDQYRQNPSSSRITLKAHGSQTDAPIACSVDLGQGNLQGASPPGSWRSGYGSLLGRLAVGRDRRLRTDHLPNGRRCHGHTYRGH